ncbi:hypothetical protein GCM10023189_37910 [Nibrella saemangeumensis]|uniref:Tetratricopeptide repeat protein n=1 Tax=Nibrella saemangeumensis TaxID=1084526 RepID=A0ABP8N5Z7_9BACT
MTIVLPIDDFLFDIFPEAKKAGNSLEVLIEELKKYYSFSVYQPNVRIENDAIIIEIPIDKTITQKREFDKVIALCERKNYTEAKKLLTGLLDTNPTNSEYHRIYGQILSEDGDPDGAIDHLIDALRWNPKNNYALIMMGNIFARQKDDIETAVRYYDQAIKINPTDNLAINNIGATLIQQGKVDAGVGYFQKAYSINPDYSNTVYGLAMAAQIQGNHQTAFSRAIEALKKSSLRDPIYQATLSMAMNLARQLSQQEIGNQIFETFKEQLEEAGGVPIRSVVDPSIPTAAKLEIAENYNLPYHTIRYKPGYPAVEHLMMHELVHLDFVIQARQADINKLFVSNQSFKERFFRNIHDTIKRLNKKGYPEESIANYCSALFDGINRQVFNAPIDLFIEDFLYNQHESLRPFQFLSLYNLVQEGLKAVTDKRAAELSPQKILSDSKVYNLVNAIQLKELYGVDLLKQFNALSTELKTAQRFYEEYKEYRQDRQPAEEYELVQHWAEDLRLNDYFELIDEKAYRSKRTDVDSLLRSIEEDPFDIETKDSSKEREMETFQKRAAEQGVNMAVVMYMVDALRYFKPLAPDQVKATAFEIAMLGTQGISPDKKGYKLNNIPDKTFTGYHLLAYYYVSWALAMPEMLPQLQLPFDEEYTIAQTMQ